ncbi:septum site-determining protein MinC [Roseateles sp. DB2]|uniref:septum site-determining protein MinC n=1 Tax=Roseateles sp. DB2 TaxID=3453717 RepID=UPI003EE8DAAA
MGQGTVSKQSPDQSADRSAQGRDSAAAEVFELRSASIAAFSLVLRSSDLQQLAQALQQRLGDTPEVFNQDPVVLDLSQLPAAPQAAEDGQLSLESATARLDFPALMALLRRFRMQAVAVSGATAEQLAAAQAAGLAEADVPVQRAEAPRVETVVKEVVREVIVEREVPVPAAPAEPSRTVIIDKPLRSGQQVYAKGADLVVMALVNHGAEVIADGNIHVYAPLRGKAIAGARGNTEARIFAASLEAELIAIAGIYRTTENPLPAEVLGKPAQVRLEGEKLVMEALKL